MRQEFPAKVRLAAYERTKAGDGKARCERCTALLVTGKFRYNHRIPDALGGQPVLENCEVLCLACDAPQTYTIDIPRIAKSKRIRKREAGIKKRSSFACSRQSRWKKKIDGSVVAR